MSPTTLRVVAIRYHQVAVVVWLLALLGCHNSGGGEQQVDVRAEIMAAEEELNAAILASGLEALDILWADDYVHTSRTGVVRTKRDRLSQLRSGSIDYLSSDRSDVRIRAYENTAIVTGLKVTEVLRDGARYSPPPTRFTRDWVRTPAGWQLAGMHSSMVVAPEPGTL